MGPTVTGGPPAFQLGVSRLRLGHQEWPLVISANAALGLARPAAGPHRTRTDRSSSARALGPIARCSTSSASGADRLAMGEVKNASNIIV